MFLKWPFVGFVVEIFGFLNLFGYVTSLWIYLWNHHEHVIQRFLPGHLDLPTATTIHRDVLNTSLCSRRMWQIPIVIR